MTKMFLEKLWLRLRGELLKLKEDLDAETDLREKAATLLETLERRLSAAEDRGSQSLQRSRNADDRDRPPDLTSLRDIEKEWEDLRRAREEKREEPEAREGSTTNPRKLG